LNSIEAARAVLAGDGSVAVVGTQSLARYVTGLQLLDEHIEDRGARCVWWAVSKVPVQCDEPNTVVVTIRCCADGQLGSLVAAIQDTGCQLATAAAFPVDTGVSVYDYLLVFKGRAARAAVEQALVPYQAARLAGAYRTAGGREG
jgi:hypothetical protein